MHPTRPLERIFFFSLKESRRKTSGFSIILTPKDKNLSKTRPIQTQEFDLEKKWWVKRVANEYAWKVKAKDLDNFNLNLKHPSDESLDEIKDPSELMKRIHERQDNVKTLLAKLEGALGIKMSAETKKLAELLTLERRPINIIT